MRKLILLCLVACQVPHAAPAHVTLDLHALAVDTQLSAQDLTNVRVDVICDSGARQTQKVSIDQAAQTFAGAFTSCGAATLQLSVHRSDAIGEITILFGTARVILAPATEVKVSVPAYLTGTVDVRLADGATDCDATFTRTQPNADAISQSAHFTGVIGASLALPVGSYNYACGSATGIFDVSFAERQALIIANGGGSSDGSAPQLLRDDVPASILTGLLSNNGQAFLVTAVFSQPVLGLDAGGVIVSNGATVDNFQSQDKITWHFTINNLVARQGYDISYTSTITNQRTQPILAQTHHFIVLPPQVYVSTKGDDLRTGATPLTAVRTLSRALSLAVSGFDVVVEEGSYTEGSVLTLPDGVNVLGGYYTGTAAFDSLDAFRHVTKITSSVLTSPAIKMSLLAAGTLNGFWINAPALADDPAAAIYVGGSSVISNNFITCGDPSSGGTTYAIQVQTGHPLIVNNVIDGGLGLASGSIQIIGGTATVVQNTLGSQGVESGRVIDIQAAGNAVITNNIFETRIAGQYGIYAQGSLPLSIQNNLFSSELGSASLYWQSTATVYGAGNGTLNALDAHAINSPTGPTARIQGNAASTHTASTLFVTFTEPATEPQNDFLLSTTGQSPTGGEEATIGKVATASDCGTYESPLSCGGSTTDRAGDLRPPPPSVGAYNQAPTVP